MSRAVGRAGKRTLAILAALAAAGVDERPRRSFLVGTTPPAAPYVKAISGVNTSKTFERERLIYRVCPRCGKERFRTRYEHPASARHAVTGQPLEPYGPWPQCSTCGAWLEVM